MNIYDAIKVLGISSKEITKEDVTVAYRQASKKYHPDLNPSGEEMMKLINSANEALKGARYPISIREEAEAQNYGAEINAALNKIIDLNGLIVEICGSWVWVSGETRTHKDTLKTNGFKFSGKKKMWFFRPSSKKTWFSKGEFSINEIRDKYGSRQVKTHPVYTLSHT